MQLPEEAHVTEAVPQLDDEAADQRRQLQCKTEPLLRRWPGGGRSAGQLDEWASSVEGQSTDRLTEDDVAAVLQGEAAGDGGGAVLHQQKHHGLLGLVAHQGHAVGQRGEQRVQSLAPLACRLNTHMKRGFSAL